MGDARHGALTPRAKVDAPPSGEKKNYRFKSDVPSPPSHTAVGGPASQLPKRKPLSEEEIEAIMYPTSNFVQLLCVMWTLGKLYINFQNGYAIVA
ncbi:hypothetical protein BRADI_2g26121v3 [Brachypodium distachyon]|uniref:Uncharacterized protein n=1 Tax=Brachypodium distachyon TaxID=15368 RepID=A0A2K2DAJ5_BRADI|nr:hypothetical protein BRADI_2g26121v3 [Brachypodium distachyon]